MSTERDSSLAIHTVLGALLGSLVNIQAFSSSSSPLAIQHTHSLEIRGKHDGAQWEMSVIWDEEERREGDELVSERLPVQERSGAEGTNELYEFGSLSRGGDQIGYPVSTSA